MPENVMVKKREPFSSSFEHLTSHLQCLLEEETWSSLIEREDGKVGLVGNCNLQILFLLSETLEVNNLASILH